jgi:hypothetical protein
MAAKKKAKGPKLTAPPAGRALQMSDLTAREKQVANENMADWGKQKSKVEGYRTSLEKGSAQDKDKKLRTLEIVAPSLTDANVTPTTAANRRVNLMSQGAERVQRDAKRSGTGSQTRDVGAGWYFSHHGDLANISQSTGVDKDLVITASSVMSPRNSPDNEKSAVASLTHLHSTNPTLSFSDTAQKHLGLRSASVKYSGLTSTQAAQLGNPDLRNHISGVDVSVLEGQAKGGSHDQVGKAIDVLRGNIHHTEAIDPHTSPKVWSYHHNIKQSVPGTDTHQEYLTRADVALFNPNQGRLDLWGLKDSKEGALNPKGHTASDTWEGAISSGQQLESVGKSRTRTSPAKVVASDSPYTPSAKKGTKGTIGTAEVSPEMVTHAWHNDANIRAGAKMSARSGETIPATLPQETGWTEARRIAGKDPAYGSRMTHFEAGHTNSYPLAPKLNKGSKSIKEYPTKAMPGINWDQFKS